MLRVLCLDIEGGYGGSSRSLFESVRHLDRNQVDVEVWCRKEGPIQPKYREIGIPTRVCGEMPRFSALPRFSRNLYVGAIWLRDFLASRGFRWQLLEQANEKFDLIHYNHEALFSLAAWMNARCSTPTTMHIRTRVIDTMFARHQMSKISAAVDSLIFITQEEEAHFQKLGGQPRDSNVIYNIVSQEREAATAVSSFAYLRDDPRMKVLCLSNYAWVRGLDLLVDLAVEVKNVGGQSKILFVMAGDMSLSKSLPGELGQVARAGGDLADYAKAKNVSEMFEFLGHTDRPEELLSVSDVLIKPTREANPWGRDILEGLGAGLPVVSLGTLQTFVEHEVTGLLYADFNAAHMARDLLQLNAEPDRRQKMGEAAAARIARLCDGPSRASDLLTVWRNAVSRAS